MQARADGFARYLETTKPFASYQGFLTPTRALFVDAVPLLFIATTEAIEIRSAPAKLLQGAIAGTTLVVLAIFWWRGGTMRSWLYGRPAFVSVIMRAAALSLVCAVGVIGLGYMGITLLGGLFAPPTVSAVRTYAAIACLLIAYAGFAFWWCAMFGVALTVIAQLAVFTVRVGFWLARAVAWRVAEYNKGAWAGLTSLLTLVLGLADVYLRVAK